MDNVLVRCDLVLSTGAGRRANVDVGSFAPGGAVFLFGDEREVIT